MLSACALYPPYLLNQRLPNLVAPQNHLEHFEKRSSLDSPKHTTLESSGGQDLNIFILKTNPKRRKQKGREDGEGKESSPGNSDVRPGLGITSLDAIKKLTNKETNMNN